MKIIGWKLKNFKGVKSLTIKPDGGNVDIFGDNATGKTTVNDAITWLLFDKDSSDRKDFAIKTLDADGNVMHGLDHEVEATFEVGGKRITLRKVYAEKWTKKRGAAKKEFTGHTTSYFVDGVPVKKAEYTARVAEIADEKVFKLLTNPLYFNEHMHWKDRRELLLDVCGDISDSEVIASDNALARLPEILGDRSLDDHRKVIQVERTRINKELNKIPVRVDEVMQGLPELPETSIDVLSATLADLQTMRAAKEQERSRLDNGGEVAERKKELAEVVAEIVSLKSQYRQAVDADVAVQKEKLNELYDAARDVKSAIREAEREISANEARIEFVSEKLAGLRDRWHKQNDTSLNYEAEDVCPTCGQDIPAAQVAEAREKAQEAFNLAKAEKLAAITEEGKAIKAEVDELAARNAELAELVAAKDEEFASLEAKGNPIKDTIDALEEGAMNYATDPAYRKANDRRLRLQDEIDRLESGGLDAREKLAGEIEKLDQEMIVAQAQIARVRQYDEGQERIEELKAQERELASEFERLEGELYLTEEFVRAKVGLLEEKINSRFEFARFKMFNTLVNGGIEETCETTYRGVPYGSGLNNGARINVGLDIIRALSDHYNFYPPIFIDNAEAVTRLVPMKAQVIRLVVSAADKKLRVEPVEPVEQGVLKEVI